MARPRVEKRVCKCGEDDPAKFSKDRSTSCGLATECKECSSKLWQGYVSKPGVKARLSAKNREKWWPEYYAREEVKARMKKYDQDYNREKLYGLSPGVHAEMLAAQDGKCAICGGEPDGRELGTDHCHASGVVRGLLCQPCNMGLGAFKDDTGLLQAAITYLENSRSVERR